MTGPKTNEGATKVGQHTGTRSVARYVRASAYKAREVLDLIRGLEVAEADGVLQFVERDIAIVIRKCLASAVANAQHNEQQDPDELFVSACFADEGPTLKRFRPRARGRAGRIRKRTCHITILVARLPEAELEKRRRRDEAKPSAARARRGAASAAAARRERVARSRQAAAARAAEHDHDHDHDHDHGAEGLVDTTTTTESGDELHPYGEGSHAPLDDVDTAPEGFDIKGNAQSQLYHVPGSRFYKATKAEVWFASEEAAEAAGFQKPPSQRAEASDDTANDTEEDA
jgi:large subunit ribosomal protein L22